MASTTLASVAAATAAGYVRTQIDYGDQGVSDALRFGYPQPRKKRYVTRFQRTGSARRTAVSALWASQTRPPQRPTRLRSPC